MATVSKTLRLAVPAEKAWAIISDYGAIHKYHPGVERSPILNGIERGVGAIRRCEFYDGSSVVEKVISWQDGRSLTVELSGMSMPLKQAQAQLQVRQAGKGTSDVTITMDFTPKFGPLGWLMGQVMMKPMMRGMFTKVLQALETHASTGRLIGPEGVVLSPMAEAM